MTDELDRLTAAVEALERRVAELEGPPARRDRLRDWTTPRLGVHRQHAPVPLMVPTNLLRTRLPAHPPSITVVTPSYNQRDFLWRTIESVVSQGYPRLEYVVADGGSDDGSRDLLEQYDRHLTRWDSQRDGGQADAVNRGFAGTGGEIMAWLNSDDMLLPGSLARVARYFAEHPEVDLVYGHRVQVDEHDLHIGSWIVPPHDDEVLTLVDYVPQETMFWRRSLWERAGGHLDERYRFTLDWEVLLRFRAAGARMVRLPLLLGAFRVHPKQKNETIAPTTGQDEMARLREQVHGRRLGPWEIRQRTRPYLLRHVALHTAHRLRERLPLPRTQAIPEMRLDRPG